MAALDTSMLTLVTRSKFLPVLKNNLYNKTRLLNLFLKKGRVKDWTGYSLQWDVIGTKHAAVGLFSGYSTVANQPINPLVQATLSNANYYATVSISKEEEVRNTGPQGAEKLLDILKTQMKNAESTLKDSISTDIYGSATTRGGYNTINGLGVAITGSTGTYANIDRSATANSFWRSNVDATVYTDANIEDPTNAGYLPRVMNTNYTNASHDGQPDIIVTTKHLYNEYKLIAQTTNLRFDNNVADLGFAGVQFDGMTMFFDDYCTSKAMYFLTSDDWSVFVVPGANFDFDEQNGSMWKLPTDQLAKVAHLLWMGQFRLDAPWQQAASTALGS